MKISDLMLTDEHRQELESCRTVGGYEGACDATDTVCRECLNRERAAIANAVAVLEEKGIIKHTTVSDVFPESSGTFAGELHAKVCGVCDLLAECRKVVGK